MENIKIILPAAARPVDSPFDPATQFTIELVKKGSDGNPAFKVETNETSQRAEKAIALLLAAAFSAAGEGAVISPPQLVERTISGSISYSAAHWFDVGIAIQLSLARAGVAHYKQYELQRMSYRGPSGEPERSGFYSFLPFGVALWNEQGRLLDFSKIGSLRVLKTIGEFDNPAQLDALLRTPPK